MGRPRWINKRCFNCNMMGHLAKNCFTRTRSQSQSRANFPRHFTPNARKNRGRGNPRYQQNRVRFQDQNNNWPNRNGYPNRNQNPQGNNGYTYNPNYNNPNYNQPPVNYHNPHPQNYNTPYNPTAYNPDPTLDQNDYNQTPDPYQYQDLN